MEDKKERLIELADKKPRLALIYGMGVVIGTLVGVIIYMNGVIRNFESVKDQALKDQAVVIKAECKEQVISLKEDVRELKKSNQDLNDRIVSRTDIFADKMTQAIQSQLDKKEKIDAQRAKVDHARKTYRAVTEEKIKQLQTQTPNEQSHEK